MIPHELVAAVTAAVVARGGRPEGAEYRFPCTEPARHANGDAHASARWNREKGVHHCPVCGVGGGTLDLAHRLGMELPAEGMRPPRLEAFALERRIPLDVLRRFHVQPVVHDRRPALRYPTPLGIARIKFLDGVPPKYRWAVSGGRAHWYGLSGAVPLLRDSPTPLYLVNGEPSVWACWAEGVPAVCLCGERVTITPALLTALREAVGNSTLPPLRVVYDVDRPGRDGARAAVEALRAGGWTDVEALDLAAALSDVPGGDVDDLHRRVGDGLAAKLADLPAGLPHSDSQAISADIAEHDGWPEPTPVAALTVPALPLDALPAVLANMVGDVAHVTKVPPDLPGLVSLGAIAAATARRALVAVGSTHTEALNLYVAAVAESGERKGPMLRAMLEPIYEVQREKQRTAVPEVAAAAERRRIAEKCLERLREQAAKANALEDRQRFTAEAEALARDLPPLPVLPKLVVSDRTPEKLEQDLADERGALLLASEEAGTLFAIAGGRYARDGGGQLDTFLKAYDGGEIDTDRITRSHVVCEGPALSIILTPQPFLLRQLRERPDFHHRGLLPRFAFAVPPTMVGERLHDRNATPSDTTRSVYREMIRRLLALPRPATIAELPRLRIEGAALATWAAYHDRLEGELREGGRFRAIREWASKHAGRVARIAGALHLVQTVGVGRPWSDRIGERAVESACRLGAYLEAHACAAYDVMNADPRLEGARALLRWIQRIGNPRFTARDAFSAMDRRRFPAMADLTLCLTVLEEHGHIRMRPPQERQSGQPGRRASPTYDVNPASLQNTPQYPQNPPAQGRSEDSADSAEQTGSGNEVWL